jgi:hypothetical protein
VLNRNNGELGQLTRRALPKLSLSACGKSISGRPRAKNISQDPLPLDPSGYSVMNKGRPNHILSRCPFQESVTINYNIIPPEWCLI